jgi:hypothetical protein
MEEKVKNTLYSYIDGVYLDGSYRFRLGRGYEIIFNPIQIF